MTKRQKDNLLHFRYEDHENLPRATIRITNLMNSLLELTEHIDDGELTDTGIRCQQRIKNKRCQGYLKSKYTRDFVSLEYECTICGPVGTITLKADEAIRRAGE